MSERGIDAAAGSDAAGEDTDVGPYRLERLLGRGGMGEVHRARDTRRDRVVALKLLPAALTQDEGFRARFRREAHTAAGLASPHVVPIHDFGEIDGRPFIDMRLVDGRDLQALTADGALPVARAVSLVLQVCDALQDAHDHGVVHRDVKPSNIIVTSSDFAYLVDFGIAQSTADTRLTATGHTVGTFGYMAPERFDDARDVDGRADVYSLACVLHELLTGRRPFGEHTSAPALIRAHLIDVPDAPGVHAPGVPAGVDELVLRALAKEPDDRPSTVREFADALRAATLAEAAQADRASAPTDQAPTPSRPQASVPTAASRPQVSVPTTASTPQTSVPAAASRTRRRRIVLVAGAAVLVVAVVVGVLIVSSSGGGTTTPQAVGQTAELPADMRGVWGGSSIGVVVAGTTVRLTGGDVGDDVGTATLESASFGGGNNSAVPCEYDVELVSALSGSSDDRASIRLAVTDEARTDCAASLTFDLESFGGSTYMNSTGREVCFQACRPGPFGGTLTRR